MRSSELEPNPDPDINKHIPLIPAHRREAGGITQEIRARTISLLPTQQAEGGGGNDGCGEGVAKEAAAIDGDQPWLLPENRFVAKASNVDPFSATFLDTPGQEIFYRMRTNGARVADAVVLVISGE